VYEFRWNGWNVDHIAEHGVRPHEAQQVVNSARPPFPRYMGDGKYGVWGQTESGRYLQVIFIFSSPGVVFVVHARPLNDGEKRGLRKRRR
jgi:uncharacterized DUF497 family protein